MANTVPRSTILLKHNYHGTIEPKMDKILYLHNMQPNGKPHVLVQHPISLIIHKAASEPTQKNKINKSSF